MSVNGSAHHQYLVWWPYNPFVQMSALAAAVVGTRTARADVVTAQW